MQRIVSTSKHGRQLTGAKRGRYGRSKYMPHQSAKEQERAARSYMQHYFPIYGPIQTSPFHLRSAPVMQVISKRDFYGQTF